MIFHAHMHEYAFVLDVSVYADDKSRPMLCVCMHMIEYFSLYVLDMHGRHVW